MNTLPARLTHPHAELPTRAHPTDAGLDLAASETTQVAPRVVTLVPTGIAVAIPEGHVGILAARSSLASKKAMTLANGVGVIPLDGCHNLIQAGQKIAQLIILPIALPTVEVVSELPESARGLGGFGSTGA